MTPALEQIKALPAGLRRRADCLPAGCDWSAVVEEELRAWADRIDTALQALRDEAGDADWARMMFDGKPVACHPSIRERVEVALFTAALDELAEAEEAARPAPAAEAAPQGGYEWWCPECRCVVPPVEVTYSEHHDGCGAQVTARAATPPSAPEPRVSRQFGGKTKALAMCPASCGCLWVNNGDGTMSLFGENSKSCDECENLPWADLLPVRFGHQQPSAPSVEMSPFDRCEFALRDAGFDYDEAFRVAQAAYGQSAPVPQEGVDAPRAPLTITSETAADVLHRYLANAPDGDHWPPERQRELRIEAMRNAVANALEAALAAARKEDGRDPE